MVDAHANFAYTTVAAPAPSTGGTTLTIQTGDHTLFPTPPFNVTIWPSGQQPTFSTAEICRCTAYLGSDQYTIVRNQEGSQNRNIGTTDQVAATITAKTLTDVETAYSPIQFFEANRVYLNTTYIAPTIGSWYVQPFTTPLPIASGRINQVVRFTNSSAGILIGSVGASSNSFHSASTGSNYAFYTHSSTVALYTRGAGANSSRLESIWGNTWAVNLSHTVVVSLNAGSLNITHDAAINIPDVVETNGLYTYSSYGGSHRTTINNTTAGTTDATVGLSSLFNVLSSEYVAAIGFNYSLTPGVYWLAQAWSSSSSTSGGTSVSAMYPFMSQWANTYFNGTLSNRLLGYTVSTLGTGIQPGAGAFTSTSSSNPPTMVFSDIRSVASEYSIYFNIMQSIAS